MNDAPPQTSGRIIMIVVGSISGLAFIGVISICLTMFFKTYAEPIVFNSIMNVTTTLIGALTGLLINTRTQPKPNGNGAPPNPPPVNPAPAPPPAPQPNPQP